MPDPRLRYPTTERNRDAILSVLRSSLPSQGLVLEVGSGSGEHAVYFARRLPQVTWQPTDIDPQALTSIAAWAEHEGLSNMCAPVLLDATSEQWPVPGADALVSINMIQIAPWEATLGLLQGAARLLAPGSPLILYGPFQEDGQHTAPSNEQFDQSLRHRDPRWGVRDLTTVSQQAVRVGFEPVTRVAMPANNLSVVFRRVGESDPMST